MADVRWKLTQRQASDFPDFLSSTWGAEEAVRLVEEAERQSFSSTVLASALEAVRTRFEDGLAGLVRDHYLAMAPTLMGRDQQKAHNLAEQKAAEARRLFRKYLLTSA